MARKDYKNMDLEVSIEESKKKPKKLKKGAMKTSVLIVWESVID